MKTNNDPTRSREPTQDRVCKCVSTYNLTARRVLVDLCDVGPHSAQERAKAVSSALEAGKVFRDCRELQMQAQQPYMQRQGKQSVVDIKISWCIGIHAVRPLISTGRTWTHRSSPNLEPLTREPAGTLAWMDGSCPSRSSQDLNTLWQMRHIPACGHLHSGSDGWATYRRQGRLPPYWSLGSAFTKGDSAKQPSPQVPQRLSCRTCTCMAGTADRVDMAMATAWPEPGHGQAMARPWPGHGPKKIYA
jgi:hypothetical protein